MRRHQGKSLWWQDYVGGILLLTSHEEQEIELEQEGQAVL